MIHAPTQSAILRVLASAGPLSCADLMVRLDRSATVLHRALRALRRKQLVHVKGWHRARKGGSPCPIYAAGEGADAPRPVPLTVSERHQRVRVHRGVLRP